MQQPLQAPLQHRRLIAGGDDDRDLQPRVHRRHGGGGQRGRRIGRAPGKGREGDMVDGRRRQRRERPFRHLTPPQQRLADIIQLAQQHRVDGWLAEQPGLGALVITQGFISVEGLGLGRLGDGVTEQCGGIRVEEMALRQRHHPIPLRRQRLARAANGNRGRWRAPMVAQRKTRPGILHHAPILLAFLRHGHAEAARQEAHLRRGMGQVQPQPRRGGDAKPPRHQRVHHHQPRRALAADRPPFIARQPAPPLIQMHRRCPARRLQRDAERMGDGRQVQHQRLLVAFRDDRRATMQRRQGRARAPFAGGLGQQVIEAERGVFPQRLLGPIRLAQQRLEALQPQHDLAVVLRHMAELQHTIRQPAGGGISQNRILNGARFPQRMAQHDGGVQIARVAQQMLTVEAHRIRPDAGLEGSAGKVQCQHRA